MIRWPWVMSQRWEHLLYAHYPVAPEAVARLLPVGLEPQSFDGSAWVTLVPLHMAGVHLRDTIPIPTTVNFPEVNLRTYVTHRGVSGVYFLAIEASSWFSVQVASRLFHLPYHDADMSFRRRADTFELDSRRQGDPSIRVSVRYRPHGSPRPARAGSIDAFLAERYVMFTADRRGGLWRGDISHDTWQIQDVDAEVVENTLLASCGLDVVGAPTFASSPGTHAVAWPIGRA